ncbi:cyclic AMP-dependent transcription factor ATF-3-like [Ylistrum balloti]|uniref:cyclic AMP-dependent transcription factor ATF-3-like n=1 Tax=Ylistrum balloti TaxID=509963 RepID=UPI002905B598|nr:cyclic AMP-dependent transcription factor ATF-3-like [Ylistrum balloti]
MAETLHGTNMDSENSKTMSPAVMEEVETEKLNRVFLSSMKEGDPLPLIKEELKYLIQSRRLAVGKEELSVKFHPPLTPQLEPEDRIKMKKRREQNRNAAQRFRTKKKSKKEKVEKELEFLNSRNNELRAKVEDLERQVHMYRQYIDCVSQDAIHLENFPPK